VRSDECPDERLCTCGSREVEWLLEQDKVSITTLLLVRLYLICSQTWGTYRSIQSSHIVLKAAEGFTVN
jgi:hypothetical protein